MTEVNGKFWKDKFLIGLMACIGTSFIFTASLCMIIWSAYTGHCAEAKAENINMKSDLVKTTIEQSAVNTQILITLAKIDGKFDVMAKDIDYLKAQTR